MAFRLCVKRYGRLPQEIVVDHGPEFGSVYFEALLAQCGCRRKSTDHLSSPILGRSLSVSSERPPANSSTCKSQNSAGGFGTAIWVARDRKTWTSGLRMTRRIIPISPAESWDLQPNE